MTKFDTKFRALATKLIDKYGKDATYTTVTSTVGSYDPLTGTNTTTAEANTAIKVFISEFSGQDYADGLIKRNDKKLLVSAEETITPELGDKVTIDSTVYQVIPPAVETWSGKQIAMYALQVRR